MDVRLRETARRGSAARRSDAGGMVVGAEVGPYENEGRRRSVLMMSRSCQSVRRASLGVVVCACCGPRGDGVRGTLLMADSAFTRQLAASSFDHSLQYLNL